MDPVDMEQVRYALLSSTPASTLDVPAAMSRPGLVVADGPFRHHAVTDLPMHVRPDVVLMSFRHINGGHTHTRTVPASVAWSFLRDRLTPDAAHAIPSVPPCLIPDDPAPGDRIVSHQYGEAHVGSRPEWVYQAGEWLSVRTALDHRGRYRNDIAVRDTAAVRALVTCHNGQAPEGWYSYQSTAHTVAHLYVDGRPVPGRRADELRAGDVILYSGGGRLQVASVERTPDNVTVNLIVARTSLHRLSPFALTGRVQEGDAGTLLDSGRAGMLYPTEPRHHELLSANELRPGDVVITQWLSPRSAVAEVTDVHGQPRSAAVNVHVEAHDGHRRLLTSIDPHYVLLHRPSPSDGGRCSVQDRRPVAA